MAFTVSDYHDLVRLLVEHPEWKSELRSLLISEELLALPETFRKLAEEVRALSEQVRILTSTVQSLTEGQQRLTSTVQSLTEEQQRLAEEQQHLAEEQQRLTSTVQSLTEGQQRLTSTVQSLTEGQQRLTSTVQSLIEGQQRLTDIVGGLKGRVLEITYREKIYGYFGHLVRRMKVVDLRRIEEVLDRTLALDEFREVLRLDLLVSCKLRQLAEAPEIWLAVEISAVVDVTDVERALLRASLLRRAGYRAVPVAAGEIATIGAENAALDKNVVLILNGQEKFWDQAVSAWILQSTHS